jgi:hypothetical protein
MEGKMQANPNNLIRLGILLLFIGIIPFINLQAFGQAAAGGLGTAAPTACPVVKARGDKSAPVTVFTLVDNHPYVTWDTLAHFPYDTPDIDEEIDPKLRLKKKKFPIPEFIKKLDGQSIAVVGFMIPLDTDDKQEKALSFILARSQATCCYGIVPKMNEWMFVQMAKGSSADAIMDIPVTVFGTFSVGEEKKTNTGWSLYRMVSDKVSFSKQSIW